MSHEFVDAVRAADWARVRSLVEQGEVPSVIETPTASVYSWLVELDAPAQIIVDLLRLRSDLDDIDSIQADLLETCLRESTTKANAYDTFALLLANGVGPNIIVDGGCTLLQMAMDRNRVREVRQLLRYGVDPNHRSVFGRESTTNLDEAKRIGNEAAQVALAGFGQGVGSKPSAS